MYLLKPKAKAFTTGLCSGFKSSSEHGGASRLIGGGGGNVDASEKYNSEAIREDGLLRLHAKIVSKCLQVLIACPYAGCKEKKPQNQTKPTTTLLAFIH